MYKKILLTQFAIPNFNTLEYKSNVHLAAGYLVGYAKEHCPNSEFVITPRVYTDLLTEDAFVDYAVNQNPDLYVFSLYLWNIEKSLRIVEKIKHVKPNAQFLFGGPEVNPDNEYLLNHQSFSQGIVGEGEISFLKFISGDTRENIAGYITKDSYNDFIELRKTYRRNTNPYLENIIEVTPDNTMFFETVRGCPFSCNFCYYNKVYDKIVPVGHDQLEELFQYARENNFDELFLLDPTFNIQPNFNGLLDKMIALNSDKRFEISTELRADYLTDEQIDKLVALNIVEVEIGLQSTNPKALEFMGRNNRITETIERTQKMIEAGIKCKVDLIVGLPGDTLQGTIKSIDDVVENGIDESMQVFKLSILSGTEFSTKREELQLNVINEPPYYLHSTPTYSSEDISEALQYAEDVLDVTLFPICVQLLSKDFSHISKEFFVLFDSSIEPIHKIVIDCEIFNFNTLIAKRAIFCETLVIHFVVSNSEMQEKLILDTIRWFKKEYPYSIYQFIVEFQNDVDDALIELVYSLTSKSESSYINRDAIYNLGEDLNLSSTLSVIVPMTYIDSPQFDGIKEHFDMYIRVETFDSQLIDQLYDSCNFYFVGESQQENFSYLLTNGLLDEFTLFDSYRYEIQKLGEDKERIYKPNVFYL